MILQLAEIVALDVHLYEWTNARFITAITITALPILHCKRTIGITEIGKKVEDLCATQKGLCRNTKWILYIL